MGVKISQLPAVSVPALTDIFPVVQAGVTYKETVTQLSTLLLSTGDFVTYTPPTVAGQIAIFTNTTGNLAVGSGTIVNPGSIQAGLSGTAGCFVAFPSIAASGTLNLCAVTNASGNFNTTISNASAILQSQTISIPDVGSAAGSFILTNSLDGQNVGLTLTTATPFNVGFSTTVIDSTTITSGDLTGLSGLVSIGSNSGGSLSGLNGEIDSTGTLTSSSFVTRGINAKIKLTNATINAGMITPLYCDWTATGTTATSMVNTSMIRLNNGSTDVLNSQIYAKGDATYLLETSGLTTAVATPGGTTPSGNVRTLSVYINGAAYKILAAVTYS